MPITKWKARQTGHPLTSLPPARTAGRPHAADVSTPGDYRDFRLNENKIILITRGAARARARPECHKRRAWQMLCRSRGAERAFQNRRRRLCETQKFAN